MAKTRHSFCVDGVIARRQQAGCGTKECADN
jgi:hypothetical protein